MSKNLWTITAKTILHVGNENTSSYGLIDLAVQRNATTELPCINSSSLKGALNEFATFAGLDNRFEIFGSDKIERMKSKKGGYTFYDANILFLPMQDDHDLYIMTTSIGVLQRFKEMMTLFHIELSFFNLLKDDLNDNGKSDLAKQLKEVFDLQRSVVILSNEEFTEHCNNENLPIIARNVLDNGESKNLWYEQVVPAESVFYTIIDNNDLSGLEELLKEDTFVQIGANATIGYGYCLFKNLTPKKDGTNE
jgi:CRISPR-associated protein Cmr4